MTEWLNWTECLNISLYMAIHIITAFKITAQIISFEGVSRQWHPSLVLLPGKSHGRRSLVGCSYGVAKSRTRLRDFTLTFHFHALEKEMATHSSVLAWRITGTGGLLSLGSHRVGHDWSDLAAAAAAPKSSKPNVTYLYKRNFIKCAKWSSSNSDNP